MHADPVTVEAQRKKPGSFISKLLRCAPTPKLPPGPFVPSASSPRKAEADEPEVVAEDAASPQAAKALVPTKSLNEVILSGRRGISTKLRLPRAKARRQRQKSEALAKQAMKSRDFSFKAIAKVLDAVHFPMNKTRKNVLPEGVEAVSGMVLGLYVYAHKTGLSDASKKNPNLARLLSKFCQDAHASFQFTSIQVNKNYAARPHVDKNNLGNSFIIGLGDYKGGDLWAHDDDGDVLLELSESIRSMHHYRAGMSYRGRTFDIHCRWQSFDGNRLHYARPFEGTRYSLVFYTCDRFQEVSQEVRRAMSNVGFTFKWSSQILQEALNEKQEERKRRRDEFDTEQKVAVREERRRVQEEMGPCMARTWNNGWGGDCKHPS
ncbi:Zdhhc9 [Symbiodinium natans]|uniref:Zdhhc9 protein n=1 Tax=Symbiodinium natans TaxID=878477 RepID=A0A812NJC4_9DINO|nr:Zdhhc9 [Symbiodinium natans]